MKKLKWESNHSPVNHLVYQLFPWKTNETEKGVTLSIRVMSNVEMQVDTFADDDVTLATSASASVSLMSKEDYITA